MNRCFYVVSWNVRGLGDLDKSTIVRNAFFDVKPSIICLQETKLDCVNHFKAKSFLPSNLASTFVFAPVDDTRGGILTAWELGPCSVLPYELFLKPHSLTTSFSFTVTNTYGPSNHSGSLPFLQNLRELPPLIGGPWILLDDFNRVRCRQEQWAVQLLPCHNFQ